MIEEIGATIPEYHLLQVLWRLFVQPHLASHPFSPDLLVVTRELVPSFNVESVIEIGLASLLLQPYEVVLPFFNVAVVFFLYFHRTLYKGLREPQIFIFIPYIKLCCLITHSFFHCFNQPCTSFSSIYTAKVTQSSGLVDDMYLLNCS